jgi:hypothetical protein
VLQILAPPYTATAPHGARSTLPARVSPLELAKELLPGLVAILVVVMALSIPVLLILWRLHRPYS